MNADKKPTKPVQKSTHETELPTVKTLWSALDGCMTADRGKLIAGLRKIQSRQKKRQSVEKDLQRLADLVIKSTSTVQQRLTNRMVVTYPELPISDKREQIAKLITDNQVVVIAGETGSGKTTQLPKICLELGRGSKGLIGHTQPRRLAARTVANRIAEELNTPLGEGVGFQVRFSDQSNENSYIKLMTDGILLAEIQNDRLLNKYDTIIIDEAHERSLNIDFILGYLKQILPKRPDLKVIITSATIDLERFSKHFNDAPVIEISGRTYPVDVLYRPLYEDGEEGDDIFTGIINATEELLSMPHRGDILVFLSGEAEIREAALALRKANFPHLEVLPLYARLSVAEQNKVFQPHKGMRIVLSTNVAETSVTVPGIRYVIDPGKARISRYSFRTKVQRLPIEPISQASANQRKGRCGRLSDGICIRLYSEEDFTNRPEFTDPEIVRTNLASVILQMLNLRIGDIREFDFVDAPDHRLINDGFNLLLELQAVDTKGVQTDTGRKLSRLQADPRLARMLLAAERERSLRELLIIVAALSIQDPRERPAEKRAQADQAHARWRDKESDFISLLNLWDHMEEQRQELSRNHFAKYCRKNFLSYMRMKEWRDLHHQLHQSTRDLKLKCNIEKAEQPAIHRALLAGLLGQVGNRGEGKEFLGTRNRKFYVFPGSALFKKPPKWIMCGELLETSKLYAHNVAAIDQNWLPELAAHLVKKSYSEPHYDKCSGQVMAYEKQTLYGLTIIERQRTPYSQIDPEVCREVFIQAALVEGKYKGKGFFFKANNTLLAELEDVEARVRRRDILVDDTVIYHFFDERIPADIVNLAGFEHWRKKDERSNPMLLHFSRDLVMQRTITESTDAQFPNYVVWQGIEYPLQYHFEPGKPNDGVTVVIPLAGLHQVPKHRFNWLVAGMLRDKCINMVKTLPKPIRRHFVPVPDYVDKILSQLKPSDEPLAEALAHQLQRHSAVKVPSDQWRDESLDNFYRMNFRLMDEQGGMLAESRDLAMLQNKYRDAVQAGLQAIDTSMERDQLTTWDFGDLPEEHCMKHQGLSIKAYPALVVEDNGVALRLLDHQYAAANHTQQGLLQLAISQHNQPDKYLRKQLLKNADLKLLSAGFPKREQFNQQISAAAYWHGLFAEAVANNNLPRTQMEFEQVIEQGQSDIVVIANEIESLILRWADLLIPIKKLLKKLNLASIYVAADVDMQLQELFGPDYLINSSLDKLRQYSRYLKALQYRLEKASLQPAKDRQFTQQLAEFREKLDGLPSDYIEWSGEQLAAVQHFQFTLQEFRVSLFAQQLKTIVPVSDKRLSKQWQELKQLF